MLERLLYISTIAAGVTDRDVKRILAAAQLKNRRLDITGVLVYCEVHFAQVLEGRSHALNEVMNRIGRDQRHRDMRVICREPIATRLFDRWGMAAVEGLTLAEEIQRVYERKAQPGDLVQRLLLQIQTNRPWPLPFR